MSRDLISHSNFLNDEIRSLREHIKKLNNRSEIARKESHNKRLDDLRRDIEKYKNRLNYYLNIKRRLNRVLNDLKPSTSGRK